LVIITKLGVTIFWYYFPYFRIKSRAFSRGGLGDF